MLNFVKKNFIFYKKNLILNKFYYFFTKISMVINGRIFRWIKKNYYMKFILPMSNKPYLFFNKSYILINKQMFFDFIIINAVSKQYFNYFSKIQKPSLFNNRGLKIFNKFIYKKRGKISAYITNK